MRTTSAEIEAIAADWAVQADHAEFDAEQRLRLDAWLAADIRHRGAFARAQSMLIHARRARALGSDFDADAYAAAHGEDRFEPQPAAETAAPPNRRSFLRWGGAGVAAAVLALGLAIMPDRSAQAFATARGEVRLIPLEDGSRLTLNTASKAEILFTAGERRVTLVEGEASFEVASDAKRPFVVIAGDTRVRAIGTGFTVRRLEGDKVQVLVREGVVEVRRAAAATLPPARGTANERVIVDGGYRVESLNSDTVRRELAWREGMLAFEDQSLGKAAEEFARYSDRRIAFADPGIAEETITGLYATNDPQGFARSAALSLGLRAETTRDGVVLRR